MRKIEKYFNVNNKQYKIEFLIKNYENSHTRFSFYIYPLGDTSPCIVFYRSILRSDYRLICRIDKVSKQITSVKEFKIEAMKYLTNS
jgi:hypothetical protein